MEKKEKVEEKVLTESDRVWDTLKDLSIEIFALPNQPLTQFCKRVQVEPSKCYLTTTVPSLISTLETVLGPRFTVDKLDKYITVSFTK